MGGKPPDPTYLGIQSYVLFGDLEIRRSEILRYTLGASSNFLAANRTVMSGKVLMRKVLKIELRVVLTAHCRHRA